MQIAEFYSHLNGYEYLMVHKPQIWNEIKKTIEAVDAEICRTKSSKEKRKAGQILYSPVDLNAALKKAFLANKWEDRRVSYWVTSDAKLIRQTMELPADEQKKQIEQAGLTPIYSWNQTDFVKDRVAVEIQFGKYAFVAFDLFVKHLAFYVKDVIDVGIEILPMKALQKHMSSGPAYYEGELYNLIREGKGVPGVPLILIGISP